LTDELARVGQRPVANGGQEDAPIGCGRADGIAGMVVPDDHQVRAIAAVLDLSWVYGELSPHLSGGSAAPLSIRF
jgi:hypothetical protein